MLLPEGIVLVAIFLVFAILSISIALR